MNLSEQLLSALTLYGIPLLCGVIFVACAGAPLPVSLLLVAAGSLADHGELNAPAVIAFGTLAAVAGDQAGFAIGRLGGRQLAHRVSRWTGGEYRLEQAEAHARQWGGTGIFLTRWLLTPLGPFVNLVSGFARYSWMRFLLWDVAGELLWVALYVLAGEFFSHQVQALEGVLSNASWAVAALAAGLFLSWKLLTHKKGPAT